MRRLLTPFFLLLLVPVTALAQPPAPKPAEATYKVWSAEGGGSATCIWVEGGKSILLGCNHVFARQPGPGLNYPLATYPAAAVLYTADGKTEYKGQAIGGSVDCDLAVIVIEGVLARAELGTSDPQVGTEVWHRGATSKFTEGFIRPYPGNSPIACHQFASDLSSISGDSGAGVLTKEGRLVAVNCGRTGIDLKALQRGTPVSKIRPVLKQVVGERFPELTKTLQK